MSAFAFYGALELGLVYGLVALGVYLTFRVLDFPDLTVDGSFPMGPRLLRQHWCLVLTRGSRQQWHLLLVG